MKGLFFMFGLTLSIIISQGDIVIDGRAALSTLRTLSEKGFVVVGK